MVISQSPDGDTPVEVGSTVTIKVSNGIPESSNATVSFTLPKGVGDSGTIKYYLNDTLYKSEKDILFSGKTKSIEVKGSGEDNTFVVTANDKKIYECKIDFTKVPGVVSDGKDFPYTDDITLPNDLKDKLKAEADSELKAAGFTNVVFKTEASDTVEEGRVIKTDPSGGSKISADKKITVYISSGPEAEEPDTDEGAND